MSALTYNSYEFGMTKFREHSRDCLRTLQYEDFLAALLAGQFCVLSAFAQSLQIDGGWRPSHRAVSEQDVRGVVQGARLATSWLQRHRECEAKISNPLPA